MAKPIANPPRVAVQSRSMPADDDADEHEDRVPERVVGGHVGVPTVSITATAAASTPESSDRERDHEVRADAEEPRGPEVGRRRAHVQPERGPVEQQHERAERDDRDHDRDDRDPSGRAADRRRSAELEPRRASRPFPRASELSERDRLEQEARSRTWRRASSPATASAAAGTRPAPSRATAPITTAKQARIAADGPARR